VVLRIDGGLHMIEDAGPGMNLLQDFSGPCPAE
jgi:hypothetical protein